MNRVVMVMASCFDDNVQLVKAGQYVMYLVLGIYRLDDPGSDKMEFASQPKALEYIRDHDGECLEGAPLPEKPEPTWARWHGAGQNPGWYYCGRCLYSSSGTENRCPGCDAKLAPPQRWDPDLFQNKDC